MSGLLVTASPAHATALAAIHAAAFPPAEAWSEAAMVEVLAMPGAAGLLHPAGGMVLTRVVLGEGEILTLAVAPEARRKGVGRVLLGRAMAASIPWFLEVAASNGAALALYSGFGFSECGRRRDYYAPGRDALVLRWAG